MGKSSKENRVLETVMQLMGERDEAIREAFSKLNGNIGNSFHNSEFKLNIIFELMKTLGITDEHIQNAAKTVQQKMEAAANGGENNHEEHTDRNPEQSEGPSGNGSEDVGEGGVEHF